MSSALRHDILSGVTLAAALSPTIFITSVLWGMTGQDATQSAAAFCLLSALGIAVASRLAGCPVLMGPNIGWTAMFVFPMYWGQAASINTLLWIGFLSGAGVALLGLFGVGGLLFRRAPAYLPLVMTAVVGVVLMGTGLKYAGVVVDHPVALTDIGNVIGRGPVVFYAGLAGAIVAWARKWPFPPAVGLLCSLVTAGTLGVFSDLQWGAVPDIRIALSFFPSDPGVFVSEYGGIVLASSTLLAFEMSALTQTHRHWHGLGEQEADRLLVISGFMWMVAPLFGVPGVSMIPESGLSGAMQTNRRQAGYGAALLIGAGLGIPALVEYAGKGLAIGAEAMLYPVPAILLLAAGIACFAALKEINRDNAEAWIAGGLACALAFFSNSLATGFIACVGVYTGFNLFREGIRSVPPVWYVVLSVWMARYIVM
ncbi:MAG: hypothetical protein FJY97_12255 [candidate division Zixibacteria bacterium]|nr:hypothetical protein [candidate division Zixibacteria bacterium]